MTSKHTQSVAAYDKSPFFEKAFRHAAQRNLIDSARIQEIIDDAATGAVQIAEYFGESTHLRKNLEVSMRRMVSLVSLYLEDTTGGALDQAAQLLKDKPFRALSRGGSQMLKALYALPEDDHFNSPRLDSEREFLKRCLTNGMSVTKYRQLSQDGERFKCDIELASWLVRKIGSPIKQFNELHASAEHVVRTGLLALAYGAKKVGAPKPAFPDEAGLFEIFVAIRKEWSFLGDVTCSTRFVEEIPPHLHVLAMEVLSRIQNEDVPKIVNQSLQIESIFNDMKNRQYFYVHDPLSDLSHFDKMHAEEWFALTGGTEDDAELTTLFLCAASGVEQKTSLKAAEAKTAVRNIRENGILKSEVLKLIDKAPHDEIEQLRSLWTDFIEDAQPYLLDHADEQLAEVMTYLSDHCHIKQVKK